MEKESRKKDNSRERKGKGKGEKNEKWKRVRLADVERKKWNKERKHHLEGRQTEISAGKKVWRAVGKRRTQL